jgi:hypothetical protein
MYITTYPFNFFFWGKKFSLIGRSPNVREEFKFNFFHLLYTLTRLKSNTVKEPQLIKEKVKLLFFCIKFQHDRITLLNSIVIFVDLMLFKNATIKYVTIIVVHKIKYPVHILSTSNS